MHRRYFLSGALIWIIGLASGFNLSPKYAQVFEDPYNQTNSYFGYSIGLQKHNKPGTFWMVVGAPKANSSAEAEKNISAPGVVYRCTTDAPKPGCQPVVLSEAGNVRFSDGPYYEKKSNSMTGATIDVTSQGGLLVCAPNWINAFYANDYLAHGICYWKENTGSNKFAIKMMPLLSKEKQGYEHNKELKFFFAYGQAGFSAHVTADGKEILLGAPGLMEWKGSVIRYQEYTNILERPSNRRRRQTHSFGAFKFVVPNPFDPNKEQNSDLFGYAVSSGNFLRPNQISFVASSPRAASLKGSISVFEFEEVLEERIKVKILLEGTQFGEYFGESLSVVDLNNDKLDDLVVGAPLYSLLSAQGGSRMVSGDEGRVYVFINKGKGSMQEIGDTNKIMGMQIPGARFGTCVSSIGDLNKDGFKDFAVGSPYEEEGRGAIYIYHGQMSGVNPKYSQRIAAREIHPALLGFGNSISKGEDIDNNIYNDIAVGAFSSGHAVLIRSRPVLKFTSSLGNNVGEVEINASGFDVEACLQYHGENLPPTLDVQIFLSVTSKAEIKSFIKSGSDTGPANSTAYSYFATLDFNRFFCKTVAVTLVKGEAVQEDNIDYTKPFELKMSYLIDERKMKPPKSPNTDHKGDTFCKNCPVVDPNDITTTTKEVLYATGCKALICQTDLAVTASFEESVGNPHKIGNLSNARMKITVDNSGEAAYLAKLNVLIPRSTPLVRIPPRCQDFNLEQGVRLECDIGNPLSNSQAKIDLELSFKDLSPRVESLSYQFNATSSGSDVNPGNNVQVLTLELEAEADMEIVGVSTQNEFVYLPEKSQTFSHKYEVINHGPSPATEVRLEFDIPVAYAASDEVISFIEVYEPTVTLNEQPFSCKPQSGHEFSERKENFGEESDHTNRRPRRSATLGDDSNDPSLNTTFFLDCFDPAVACMTITCDPVGPFFVMQSRALLSFKMMANLTKLAPILNMRDAIAVSSRGSISINPSLLEKQPTGAGTRADTAIVVTMFYGSIKKTTLAAWIWILAVLGGILLLLIISGVLYKTGFFKRKGKEDLQELKDNDALQLDSMANENSTPENEMKDQEDAHL